jgi:methyl-accepting chemotaxis protein
METSFATRLSGRMGISFRLAIAFSSLILLSMAMAAVGAWRLAELDRVTDHIARVNMRIERAVGMWYAETKSNSVRAVVITHTDDDGLKRLLAPELDATSLRITELQKEVEKLVDGAEAKALFDDIGAQREKYLSIRKAVLEKKKAGQTEEALALLDKSMLPAVATYVASIKKLVDHYSVQGEKDAAAAAAAALSGRNVLLGACAIGVLLGIIFSWLITRSIRRPLMQAVSVAGRVAAGDLDVRVPRGDNTETGQLLAALERMTSNLRHLVGEVAEGANTVSNTSAQIAQGNLDLSQRTEEQASTLEETASSMEELTTTVARNADNARQASEVAAGATEVARQGGEVVSQVIRTMNDISDSSKKIAEIISVIDGIAFQTNILALNAAVEAARAGEQGRGFAVVATEVRNLAHRSAAAAKEIKELIGSSVGNVQTGTTLVDRAGHTMDEIVSSVKQVSELIAEIAAASREQSAGLEQVNTAVMQMEHVVQQNASLVEEAAAGTESMRTQANSLLDMVSRFTLGERDDGGARTAAPAAPAESSARPAAKPRAEEPKRARLAPAFAAALGAGRAPRALPSNSQWAAF